ncbi:MAG: ABC transporter ATP-binding protein/permease [Lachnospiraceae bacterium]|nr:ABC transporter ATP-binding protein/permease [Lachnospiraceae bacterium]
MIKILKKLNRLLDRKQKRLMVVIIFCMLIGGVLESLSISGIIPVVTILLEPDVIETNIYLASLYHFLGLTSVNQLMVVMMVALIGAFVLKNLFLFLQNVIQLRFVYTNQFATSRRMMINFMKRPYEYYLNADTAVIQRSITSDVNNMYGLILNLLQLVSEVVVFVCIAAVLLVSDGRMVLFISVLLILVLWLIKVVIKPIMTRAGKENQDYYSGLFKWIEQAVMGIKEIKIANKEQYFINEYAKCGYGYVNAVQKYNLFNSTPRLLIETVCITGLVLYIMLVMQGGTSVEEMLPQLTVFGFAAMRLIPSANRINNHLTNISYFEPFFMGVSDHLQEEIHDENIVYDPRAYEKKQEVQKLEIKEEIFLKDITYKYPNTQVLIFDHANMRIPIGAAVGIVGSSGSGKTTVVDILLGLLRLESGEILADGVAVKEHYEEWLKNIGYIPQTIFMLDSTIRSNVAFGYAPQDIDEDRVWAVLKEAQLDEFVRGLPKGLDTSIGERGIRLSGGQRQRIGIARALFEDPEVLVLDEATSALDNDTEAAIMESINRLHGRKTLIIIAHRLQTIEKCDMVYRVEKGKVSRER